MHNNRVWRAICLLKPAYQVLIFTEVNVKMPPRVTQLKGDPSASKKDYIQKKKGDFLVVERLGLHTSTARRKGSTPGELRSHKPYNVAKKINNFFFF